MFGLTCCCRFGRFGRRCGARRSGGCRRCGARRSGGCRRSGSAILLMYSRAFNTNKIQIKKLILMTIS